MQDSATDNIIEQLGAYGRIAARIAAAEDPGMTEAERALMAPLSAAKLEALLQQSHALAPARDVIVVPRWRTRGPVLALAGLLAAAAVLAAVWWPETAPPSVVAARTAYEVSVIGGTATTRGGGSAVFRAGDELTILVTPARPVQERVQVRVRATMGDHRVDVDWPVTVMDPAEGALRVDGSIAELLSIGAGTWELELELRASGSPDAPSQRLTAAVEVRR